MNGTRWQGSSYEMLSDAAEDIGGILDAAAAGVVDLSDRVQAWLLGELDAIECVLAEQLDAEPTHTSGGKV